MFEPPARIETSDGMAARLERTTAYSYERPKVPTLHPSWPAFAGHDGGGQRKSILSAAGISRDVVTLDALAPTTIDAEIKRWWQRAFDTRVAGSPKS